MPTERETVFRWPSWIPPGVIGGYTASTTDLRISPDFDWGTQFRVEFDADETLINCTLFVDSLQANWFEAFERDVLRQGSRWFLMDLWIGGQMVQHRARFKKRLEASNRIGLEWIEYSFQLEIFKRQGLRRLSPLPNDKMSKWPETMPVPLVDGYGVNPQDRREATEFDIGSQFRVLLTTDETKVPCTLMLDPDEANWFESFERGTLVQGSRWFLMDLWIGGQMVEHTVRFASRPQATREEGVYTSYSFELDISGRLGLMDTEWVEYLTEEDPYEFILGEDRLQIIMNEKLPISLPFPY